ncbi:MAG: export ABC transporter ATP-binding protein [Deltaproteobacteria bacterium HGW-Deltaproteobacteria-19]|jgi:ABC-2 type transport system ATP-binding protein|nr:MAG: export ABC transporter ATP-binding protein [Deltaproteobacteria bacterium HGW-Deltaproteobacteria-19]
MIVLESLSKSYGRQKALDDLSLTFREGAITGLLGPNGAGKTTLLSILMGILPRDRGQVVVGGYDLDGRLEDIRRISCLVPQNLSFYSALTARENLSFFGSLCGLSGRALSERMGGAVAAASLESFLDKRVETYSGGMKRRLNLAIGLLGRPRVLYLDEPTVGVDAQSRTWILETIRRINREDGVTVVYASHYMDEVEQVADDLVILDEGRVVLEGGRDTVLAEADALILDVAGMDAILLGRVRDIGGVTATESAVIIGAGPGQASALKRVLLVLEGTEARISGLKGGSRSLEDLFLRITTRALRDE